MSTGYCAWSFVKAVNSPYKDPFIERFKALIDSCGLHFPNEEKYDWEVIRKFSMEPESLTEAEWRSTSYCFLKIDRQALIKLSLGETAFTKNETEALEALYGDFFTLCGMPKYALYTEDVPFKRAALET